MDCLHLPYDKLDAFSPNDLNYIRLAAPLREFYAHPPTLERFPEVIRLRRKSPVNRKALVRVLERQYRQLPNSVAVRNNVRALADERTFTITTAHQPNLFTGPLYYIYKIVSVINLSRDLRKTYPEYRFVPVFWMGGEDHDFEEINHAKIFRERLEWQSGESGSAGRMSTKTLRPVVAQLAEVLGNSLNAEKLLEIFHSALDRQSDYGGFTIDVTHQLFKDKGLVIIDASQSEFKRLAIPLFRKEILERPSEELVMDSQHRLEQIRGLQWKPQAFPRTINLFYMGNGFRERLAYEDGNYVVLKRNIRFNESDVLDELEEHPGRFSPNVILRPLYQEWLLPNLAYIGGGGELAYWLERKAQFEAFGVPYPMLVRRDSVLWLDSDSRKKMLQLDLKLENLWRPTEELFKKTVRETLNGENTLSDEIEALKQTYQSAIRKAVAVDGTLQRSAEGELVKAVKGLTNLENKIFRAVKRKHEHTRQQIEGLRERLFPGGNLQERKDNFMSIYLKEGDAFFEALYQNLNALDRRVKVILGR